MTALAPLLRLRLRTDRIFVPAWALGIAVFALYIGAALPSIVEDEAELQSLVGMINTPAGRLLVGPGYGLEAVTFEVFFSSLYGLYFAILTGLMSIFIVVRHTRAEEANARAELIRAGALGRRAPLHSALLMALGANLLAGVLVLVITLVTGFDSHGSILFATGIAVTGMAFAGIAAVTAQVATSSAAASGLAGALLGVSFVLRGIGDMLHAGGSWLSWTNPLGWMTQTAPYVLNRWWPLLPGLAVALLGAGLAHLIAGRRDLGAGLFAQHRGRAAAPSYLRSAPALAWRLHYVPALWWGLGVVLTGVVDGAFAHDMAEAENDLPPEMVVILGEGGMLDGYLGFITKFVVILILAYVIFAVQILWREERSGRSDEVLATRVRRPQWLLSHVGVVAVGAAAILVVAAVATGVVVDLTAPVDSAAESLLWPILAAHLNLLAPILLMLGLMTALHGLIPRWAGVVGWSVFGVAIFLDQFGALMQLPAWLLDASPLGIMATMPAEDFDPVAFGVVSGIGLVLIGLGVLGYQRRELHHA